jgi:hypothetical protein
VPSGASGSTITSAEDEMSGRRLLPFLTIVLLLLAPACGGSSGFTLPDLTPFQPDLMAQVHEIRDRAAEARGLEPNEEVSEGTLTREELAVVYEDLEAQMREGDEQETEAMTIAYRLLNLIGPEDDLLELYAGMMSSQVVGLYSTDEDKLVLIGDGEAALNLEDEITLAHEYVHSFQDAAFDLDWLEELQEEEAEDRHNTEYSVTVQALMEGDATMSSIEYVGLELGEGGFIDWLLESAGELSEDDESFPPALQRYLNFPYIEGSQFVLYLWAKGGWEEVNKAYEDPPRTTEQILHPEKYLEGEKADELKLPDLSDDLGDGWEQIDDRVFGEFDVYNYLMTAVEGTETSSEHRHAADGWGGGRIAVYADEKDEDRALVHLVITWDTVWEGCEFMSTYMTMFGSLPGEPEVFLFEPPTVRWKGEGEYIYSWLEGEAVTIVIATDRSDLESAIAAIGPATEEERRPSGCYGEHWEQQE